MINNKELLVDTDGPVCTITINRPEKLNALSPYCLQRLSETLGELAENNVVRSVIICGSGNKAFSSGYDITALSTNTSTNRTAPLADHPLDQAIRSIVSFPYPVIAMISGYAYGAGCTLALSCDIRIAAKNARMGMHAAKRGIVPHLDELGLFLKVIGFSHALEMFQTGRTYDSQRCFDMGLVNYMVEDDQLRSFTNELASELAENAPLSLRGTKLILNKIHQFQALPEEIVREAHELQIESINSEDKKESIRAFKEKRKPKFQGC